MKNKHEPSQTFAEKRFRLVGAGGELCGVGTLASPSCPYETKPLLKTIDTIRDGSCFISPDSRVWLRLQRHHHITIHPAAREV